VLRQTLPYAVALGIAFALAGIFIHLMGYDVLRAYQTILFTSFRSANSFVQTILKFIPVTLLALAFTVPFAAGKYNIGGEGQMIVGATGATVIGILLRDEPAILVLPLALVTGVLFGAIWGLIPAWLLLKFRIHEILTTTLFNFISYSIIDYIATEIWRDPVAGHPTTIPIGNSAWLPLVVRNPPLHSGIVLALLIAAAVWVYMTRTTGGYEMVATGANPEASKIFGIKTSRMFMLSLVIGGALAGLAGAVEVEGYQHRLIVGLQSNFLQLGLITGLIAKGNNFAVPFVAFFIAMLEVGASAMQRTMQIPVEFVFIVEALVLLCVLLSDVVRRREWIRSSVR